MISLKKKGEKKKDFDKNPTEMLKESEEDKV